MKLVSTCRDLYQKHSVAIDLERLGQQLLRRAASPSPSLVVLVCGALHVHLKPNGGLQLVLEAIVREEMLSNNGLLWLCCWLKTSWAILAALEDSKEVAVVNARLFENTASAPAQLLSDMVLKELKSMPPQAMISCGQIIVPLLSSRASELVEAIGTQLLQQCSKASPPDQALASILQPLAQLCDAHLCDGGFPVCLFVCCAYGSTTVRVCDALRW